MTQQKPIIVVAPKHRCPYCNSPHVSSFSPRGAGHWSASCMQCNAQGPDGQQTGDDAVAAFCNPSGAQEEPNASA